MHGYMPGHIAGTVPATATIVDLEKGRIESPIGTFHVTNVSDTLVSFDDVADRQLVVFGTFHRVSGLMRVVWRKPEGKRKPPSRLRVVLERPPGCGRRGILPGVFASNARLRFVDVGLHDVSNGGLLAWQLPDT
jgi:hypothetical protein